MFASYREKTNILGNHLQDNDDSIIVPEFVRRVSSGSVDKTRYSMRSLSAVQDNEWWSPTMDGNHYVKSQDFESETSRFGNIQVCSPRM